MENFLSSLLSGLIGSGIGGAIIWLAAQKVIDDRIEKKQEVVWNVIDKIKKDYQPKDVCKVIHEYAEKDTKRIEETLQRIEKLILENRNEPK